MSSTRIRCIIDTDPGVDDMHALLLALSSDRLQVEAITLTYGNHTDLAVLERNACIALHMAHRTDVPVVRGATRPLYQAPPPPAAMVDGQVRFEELRVDAGGGGGGKGKEADVAGAELRVETQDGALIHGQNGIGEVQVADPPLVHMDPPLVPLCVDSLSKSLLFIPSVNLGRHPPSSAAPTR